MDREGVLAPCSSTHSLGRCPLGTDCVPGQFLGAGTQGRTEQDTHPAPGAHGRTSKHGPCQRKKWSPGEWEFRGKFGKTLLR